MVKQLLTASTLALLLAACGSQNTQTDATVTTAASTTNSTTVTVDGYSAYFSDSVLLGTTSSSDTNSTSRQHLYDADGNKVAHIYLNTLEVIAMNGTDLGECVGDVTSDGYLDSDCTLSVASTDVDLTTSTESNHTHGSHNHTDHNHTHSDHNHTDSDHNHTSGHSGGHGGGHGRH